MSFNLGSLHPSQIYLLYVHTKHSFLTPIEHRARSLLLRRIPPRGPCRYSRGCSRRQCHIRLRMRRIRRPIRSIRPTQRSAPVRQDQMIDDAIKRRQATDRLVKRYFVPGLIHAQETELAVLAHFAVLGAVDDKGGVAGGVEFFRVRVLQCEGDGLAAEPVADVVSITVDEGDTNAVVEDALEIGFEDRVDEVACGLEGVGDGGVGFGVI